MKHLRHKRRDISIKGRKVAIRVAVNGEVFIDGKKHFKDNRIHLSYYSKKKQDTCTVLNKCKAPCTCNNRFLIKSKETATFPLT